MDQLLGFLPNFIEHFHGQLSGQGILLAGMIRTKQVRRKG
jgi:hypothetical protein